MCYITITLSANRKDAEIAVHGLEEFLQYISGSRVSASDVAAIRNEISDNLATCIGSSDRYTDVHQLQTAKAYRFDEPVEPATLKLALKKFAAREYLGFDERHTEGGLLQFNLTFYVCARFRAAKSSVVGKLSVDDGLCTITVPRVNPTICCRTKELFPMLPWARLATLVQLDFGGRMAIGWSECPALPDAKGEFLQAKFPASHVSTVIETDCGMSALRIASVEFSRLSPDEARDRFSPNVLWHRRNCLIDSDCWNSLRDVDGVFTLDDNKMTLVGVIN